MPFIKFVLRETTPKNIALAILALLTGYFILPVEFEKEIPLGFQYVYFILIFLLLSGVGFVFSILGKSRHSLTNLSPVFSQASSAVISLSVFLLPIYFLRQGLFSLMFLMFVVELGLVFGKFVYHCKAASEK